ncbi:MFS transporter [Paenibacillus sp. CC-CFT747]|nr:MFS transporter [Paenibacillus sp. CC-CFT747]
MSRLEVFFGIGALVIPILAGICIWLGFWNTSFLTVGGLSLLLAILWARLSFGELDAALARKPKTVPEPGQETGYRGKALVYFSLFVAFFFLYVGLEMSLVNFFPSILLEKFSMESAGASVSVTLFWLAMAIGRIFAGTLSMRVGYGKYLVWGCAGTLLCLAGLRLAPYYGLTFGFLMLAGLAMAGLFSIALVYASHILPGREERTTSLLIGAGGLGGAVLPLLTGWSMDHWKVFGTQSLLAAVSLLLILMVGAALVMERTGRTERTG